MKTEAKILICYNAPVSIFPVYNGKPVTDEPKETDLSEKNFLRELNVIKRSLAEFYTEVETLAIYRDVQKSINNINKFNPDVIYNFVESVEGIASYEWCIAGLFELLGFEYTGCNPASLGNCLNKARAKNILNSRGIKTPQHITLKPNARFTKKDIRTASKNAGLKTWKKPAYACLLTRIPYDTKISKELLHRIEQAETYLIGLGIRAVRVRTHDNLARIETEPFYINKIFKEKLIGKITTQLKQYGFSFVTLDLEGYKTGGIEQIT